MNWMRDPNTGHWFLYLGSTQADAIAVGYFPRELYSPGALAGPASVIQFGGETAPPNAQVPSTPMGSGSHPTGDSATDFQKVAFQNHVSIQVQGEAFLRRAALTGARSDEPTYGAVPGSSPAWGSFFFFGGG